MPALISIQISVPFRPLTTQKNRASHSPRQLFAAKLAKAAKPFCTVVDSVTSRICRVPAAVTPKENAEPTTQIVIAEKWCPLESWVLISDARLQYTQYTSTARQWAICRQAYKLIYKLYKSHWPRVPHCLLSNKHAMMQEWDGEKNVAIYLDLSS